MIFGDFDQILVILGIFSVGSCGDDGSLGVCGTAPMVLGASTIVYLHYIHPEKCLQPFAGDRTAQTGSNPKMSVFFVKIVDFGADSALNLVDLLCTAM